MDEENAELVLRLQRLRARRNRGISMAELMLVLAIAAILTVFFVYSSRSLVIRTKVSRVKEEQRQLARALQNYQIDHSTLPDIQSGLEVLKDGAGRYIGELPHDPFQKAQGTYAYLSATFADGYSVLISPGPDGDIDIPDELQRYVSFVGVDQQVLRPVSTSSLNSLNNINDAEEYRQYLINLLKTYIEDRQYDPSVGEDGDIVTVIGQ